VDDALVGCSCTVAEESTVCKNLENLADQAVGGRYVN